MEEGVLKPKYPYKKPKLRGVKKAIFNNHLRAALLRVRTYLRSNKIITNFLGVKQKHMIQTFAERHGLSVVGKPREWLVELYRSGDCVDCCQSESGFYDSDEWIQLRTEVLSFYGRVCMRCGSSKNPHVDHIKPRSKFPELELSFDNMQVLCQKCNFEKGNRNSKDYRPQM